MQEALDSGRQIAPALHATFQAYNAQPVSLPAQTRSSPRDAYWKNNTPVLVKTDYNGESISIPKLAPRDESRVGIRKTIFNRLINNVRHHVGSLKANWTWKCQVLDTHFQGTVTGLLNTTKQVLPTLSNKLTLNVGSFSDVNIYTANMAELVIDDPGDANAILADSRRDCRFIQATYQFAPQNVIPQGTQITATDLPEASTVRVTFRAPQDPAGGLNAAITKAILTTTPEQIFQLFNNVELMAHRQSTMPMKDIFDAWFQERLHEAYFEGMVIIAKKNYIGDDIVTDELRHRLHGCKQKYYDQTGKAKYRTVNELAQAFDDLLAETNGMDDAAIQQQVPELDQLFYNALVPSVSQTTTLAPLLNHAASQNIGENRDRLQQFVNACKLARGQSHGQHRPNVFWWSQEKPSPCSCSRCWWQCFCCY